MEKRVLVIDDVQEDRELIEAVLDGKGYKVECADDGDNGLEKAKKLHPALIVVDILMPRMNGLEFFKELRKDAELSKAPVLVMSSRAKMADSFLSLGVNGFMAKPITIDRFLQEVEKLANPMGEKLSAPPQAKASTPAPTPAKEEAPASPQKKAADAAILHSGLNASLTGKKVIIFGDEEATLKSMQQDLEKAGHAVLIVRHEDQILSVVQDARPDMVLLAVNAETKAPVDKLVYTIDVLFPKQKPGEVKKNADGTLPSGRKMQIVLYKIEKESAGMSDSEGSLADMDSLLERCKENGASKYIGPYASFSFVSKVKEFLK